MTRNEQTYSLGQLNFSYDTSGRISAMVNGEFSDQKEQLESYFRRFGIEGETAFHTIAYHYTYCYSEQLKNLPTATIQKWQTAYQRIEKQKYVIAFLDQCVADDQSGAKLSEWYQFFIGRRFREASGKFFTPKIIATIMAHFLPPKEHPLIMDPTCGGGTFLMEAANIRKDQECRLLANDIESSLIELSMLTLSLATPIHHQKEYFCTDIYRPSEQFRTFYGKIDYILANPPFSVQIYHEQFDSPLFRSGYRNSDALFIDIALKLLRPGGRLVCLLPHSIIANKEFVDFRTIVEKSWEILGVIGLPEGVFLLSAGTTTRADILILEKKSQPQIKNRKILFASVPSVGLKLTNNGNGPISNDLATILNNREVRRALKL